MKEKRPMPMWDLETTKMVIARKYLMAGHRLIGYKVQEKKSHEKRSTWDASKHLFIFFLDDKQEICRVVASHNNNQHLKIDNYTSWYESGFEKCAEMTSIEQPSHLHWSKS